MFAYQYDFGDSWMHKITVEKIEPFAYKMGCANIIDGQRACPPEDVGGPPGYDEFLNAIQEAPDSQQAQDNLMWVAGSFDPEAFDRRVANNALLRMGWNGKVVGWEVHAEDEADHASHLVRRTALAEGIAICCVQPP
jgi:hypothetical protein